MNAMIFVGFCVVLMLLIFMLLWLDNSVGDRREVTPDTVWYTAVKSPVDHPTNIFIKSKYLN